MGFAGGASGKEPLLPMQETWETRFNPWVGKTPWRKAWQPTPVSLPGESPWTEEPGGLQSMGSQRVRHDWSDLTHNTRIYLSSPFLPPLPWSKLTGFLSRIAVSHGYPSFTSAHPFRTTQNTHLTLSISSQTHCDFPQCYWKWESKYLNVSTIWPRTKTPELSCHTHRHSNFVKKTSQLSKNC